MPRFAANLSFLFQEYDFLDRFEAAAAAGFRGVEYVSPYEHPPEVITQQLEMHQLEQVLFNLPAGDWAANERGVAALPGREAEFEASVQQALDYARMLKCHQVHAMAGIAPDGSTPEACEAVYIRNLRHAVSVLQPHGIRLLIEPINARDMPGYFLNTSTQARRIIDAVGSDNLFLQMDLYHCQVMEGDLAERIKTHLDVMAHIQIAGNPGRHEPDIGEIHYPYLFDLIDKLGYSGWIGCEYHPLNDTASGLCRMQDLMLNR
jgi:hydroxypyruvate isomerase